MTLMSQNSTPAKSYVQVLPKATAIVNVVSYQSESTF